MTSITYITPITNMRHKKAKEPSHVPTATVGGTKKRRALFVGRRELGVVKSAVTPDTSATDRRQLTAGPLYLRCPDRRAVSGHTRVEMAAGARSRRTKVARTPKLMKMKAVYAQTANMVPGSLRCEGFAGQEIGTCERAS